MVVCLIPWAVNCWTKCITLLMLQVAESRSNSNVDNQLRRLYSPRWSTIEKHSVVHSSTVVLIRNLCTGSITQQFHCVYDYEFETTFAYSDTPPVCWENLVIEQRYQTLLASKFKCQKNGYRPVRWPTRRTVMKTGPRTQSKFNAIG